jgi:hypothetical protein
LYFFLSVYWSLDLPFLEDETEDNSVKLHLKRKDTLNRDPLSIQGFNLQKKAKSPLLKMP